MSARLLTIGPVFGAGRPAGSMRNRRPISCSVRKFCFSASCFAVVLDAGLRARQASCRSTHASANAAKASAAHTIGDGRSRIGNISSCRKPFAGSPQPQSIAGISAGSRLHQMSGRHTLHRADVMHVCYSVSAIAMQAQKASWHHRQSLTPAPATQSPRRAVLKAPAIRPRQESRRTRTRHHRR